MNIPKRPRRNRASPAWRDLVTETLLTPKQFVYPIFVTEEAKTAIPSMPGIFRLPIEELLRDIEEAASLGVQAVNLFCHVPEDRKDPQGSEALNDRGLLPRAIRAIKREFPHIVLMADIALDPFTSHGLDGVINQSGYVLNDETIHALGQMALVCAEAGTDLISPSDMMDGRVAFLRKTLDERGFIHVGILSYAVKFASSLYAPFRSALGSTPKQQYDKKTFQVPPPNGREALLECLLDESEAADMLLIKPAITSLDIIAQAKAHTLIPVGAYQVSGEYAMIQAAHQQGWLNGPDVLMESLIAIRRAGADFIVTYAAKEAARLLARATPRH